MSQKLSRRNFLKTAGAVAVAAAAMSTLTACGGGGSSTPAASKPATPTTPTALGSVEIQDIYHSYVRWTNKENIPFKWFITLNVTVKNTSDKDIPLGDFGIKTKIDGTDRTPDYVEREIGDDDWEYVDYSTLLKAGETMTLEVEYETTETAYKEWKAGTGNHVLEATLSYSGKKVSYSSKTGKLSDVEDA